MRSITLRAIWSSCRCSQADVKAVVKNIVYYMGGCRSTRRQGSSLSALFEAAAQVFSMRSALVAGCVTISAAIACALQSIGKAIQIIKINGHTAERARADVRELIDVAVGRGLIRFNQAERRRKQLKIVPVRTNRPQR